jgi:hypothetical protein
MDLEKYFDSIDQDAIENFVKIRKQEDVFLEFKTTIFPNQIDDSKNSDKKNLSKILSGFGNSNGGIAIWGISASKNKDGVDVAKKLSPIKNVNKFLNMLNSLEGQAVTPIIEGVRHELICINDDEGYVKTFVPKSNRVPHMALYADKYYYKRSGDSFYRAEHFDIEDMFFRREKTDLELEVLNPDIKETGNGRFKIEITVAVKNLSRIIARFPYLALSVNEPYGFSKFGLDGNGSVGLNRITNNNSYKMNYSGGSEIVIYPDISHEVAKIGAEFRHPIPGSKIPDIVIDYQLTSENMMLKENRLVYPADGIRSKYLR